MKTLILSTLFLFSILAVKGQDSLELEGELQKATVFFAGSEMTRQVSAELDQGRNILVFEGLTPSLEERSIRLNGGKGLRIRSVEKRVRQKKNKGDLKKRLKAKKDSLEEIDFKLSLRQSMKKVYSEEKNMILENKDIKGEQTGTNIEDLMELAVYYRKRLKDIEYKLIEVNDDIEELQKDRKGLRQRIRKLERKGRERAAHIIVSLEAEQRGRKKLELTYFSPRAGWKPAYELNCPSLGDPVEMTYKGEVWQQTGNDWKGVELTLASGRPTRSGDQPELKPWRLDFNKKRRNQNYSQYSQQKQERAKAKKRYSKRKQEPQQSDKSAGAGRAAEGNLGDNERSASQGVVQTRFSIDSRYDISSGRSTRSVTIDEMNIDAAHDHLAIPKKEQKAFLIAKLSGWEKSDLFPGQASVQYAGRYVGKTHIDPNITEDTLEVSLGRDQGVVVDRKKVRDKTSSQIIGGKKVLEAAIDIEIKNKRQEAVKLRVKDQIPLSSRGDVEVSLEKHPGASYDKETGALNWKVELEPGGTKTLHFAYTVKYPKELDPVGL